MLLAGALLKFKFLIGLFGIMMNSHYSVMYEILSQNWSNLGYETSNQK